jgi:hypothetical protein
MKQDEAFIQHFEVPVRSTISNAFLDAIRRDQARDAREVVTLVLDQAVAWLRQPYTRSRGELTIALIGEFEEEALAYAEGKFAYLALSDEEKRRRKWEKGEQHALVVMKDKPVSQNQRNLLLAWGYTEAEIPTDMAAASELIKATKKAREGAGRA